MFPLLESWNWNRLVLWPSIVTAASDMTDNRWRMHSRGERIEISWLDFGRPMEFCLVSKVEGCGRPARPPSVQYQRWKKRIRCLYVNVVRSMIFYGAPIWVLRTYRKPKFNHVRFNDGWSLERAYRTISHETCMRQLTLIGMISFDLIAEIDAELPEKRFDCDRVAGAGEVEDRTVEEWRQSPVSSRSSAVQLESMAGTRNAQTHL